jgi:hypothetical protein
VRAVVVTRPHDVIEQWVAALPDTTTNERVHSDLWYVRIPGTARSWIPVEILVDEKTTKITSHVIIEPDERRDEVYELLLRHNHRAPGVAFSLDGKEGVICLVARVPHDELTVAKLDLIVGQMIDVTEATFRSILEIGFGSRLRKRS